MRGRSKASKTKQDKDFLMSSPTFAVQPHLPWFATAELALQSSETTSTDKLPICNRSTQNVKSSETLVAASTSKEKDCVPYWTDFCKEISSRLLLPTATASQGLDSSLFSIWSSPTVENSWFSTQLYTHQNRSLQQIFSQSSTSSLVGCMDYASIVKRSRKIRVLLTQQQRQILKSWFGVSRFVYNTTIKILQNSSVKANWKEIKTGILNDLPDWCKPVPYQIKSIAIKDACKSVSNAKKKYKNGFGISRCRFRSRKEVVQSCYIPKSAVSSLGIYHTILGEAKFKEALPSDFGDCRLVKAYGDYYLAVPENVPQLQSDNQGRVVALDPGIRTFNTFFSESSFGELGIGANLKIQKLCFKLDKLISRLTKAKSKQKRRMLLAATRLRGKIKNLVDELHKKTARFLVDNFDIILLPTFETSQMASKAKRRIRSKSVRQMLTLSHYKFKQFLKHKAFENSKIVLDVNEAYTSKTVSWTGEIIHKLGGSKIIKSSDGSMMPRDWNGARGIFLRALVDTPSLKDCIC